MTAGLNLKATLWSFSYSDDSVGGALPTGTPLYHNVEMRISPIKPTMALLEQGLETVKLFTGVLAPPYLPTGTFNLPENYQVEITSPVISEYYGKKFVNVGSQPATMNDPRKYWVVTLRREETANSNNLQT